MRIPLLWPASGESGTHITFYAREGRAFEALAAEARRLHRGDAVVLDGHLGRPEGTPGPGPLQDRTDVDQAVGVLLDRGSTPDEAIRFLKAEAVEHGTSVAQTARLLLAGVAPARLRSTGVTRTGDPITR